MAYVLQTVCSGDFSKCRGFLRMLCVDRTPWPLLHLLVERVRDSSYMRAAASCASELPCCEFPSLDTVLWPL